MIRRSKFNVELTKSETPGAIRSKIRALVTRILGWFPQHARDLPWRRTLDPYAIWVSEIMLQQTQVKTVIPYWERWMRELSNLRALARARPDRVLKLWEGLGYYSRARNLHQAARTIAANGDSNVPATFDEVLALPGVGRYTAGAICSIAFNHPAPILDGNVIRVLTRVFGIAGDPRSKIINRRLWGLAETLVARAAKHSGSPAILHGAPVSGPCSLLNQALMELGALVCTPVQPRCDICPLRRHCVAHCEDRVNQLPTLTSRPESIERRVVAFVVGYKGRWLVRQRPTGVVNAHLWEFPNVEVNGNPLRATELLEKRFGFPATRMAHLGTIRHSITHFRITVEAFLVQLPRAPGAQKRNGQWTARTKLDSLPFASAHRRILNLLLRQSG